MGLVVCLLCVCIAPKLSIVYYYMVLLVCFVGVMDCVLSCVCCFD